MISLIVAHDLSRCIGKEGNMPWGTSIKIDLEWFKKHTLHKTVLMGRKTFDSIGRKLPNRNNVILTRDNTHYELYRANDCFIVNSPEEFLSEWHSEDEEVFIIGGSTLYRQFLPIADRLYITQIMTTFIGDTYFPEYNLDEFKVIYERDDYDIHPLKFSILER